MDRTARLRKTLFDLRAAIARASADDGKVTMKLTDPISDPWTHQELFDENDAGEKTYKEFHTGDLVEVTPDTAEHLYMSGQAELAEV